MSIVEVIFDGRLSLKFNECPKTVLVVILFFFQTKLLRAKKEIEKHSINDKQVGVKELLNCVSALYQGILPVWV